MQSLKFEHKLYNSVKNKMEEMQQHNMSWIEVNKNIGMWLKNERSFFEYSKCLIYILGHFRWNTKYTSIKKQQNINESKCKGEVLINIILP